jgi:hypothetical protein
MTYAGIMILDYTVLVGVTLGVTLGSLLIVRLLRKTSEQAPAHTIQAARRS